MNSINKYTGKPRTDQEVEKAIEMVWIMLYAGLQNKEKSKFFASRIDVILQGW